MVLMMAMQQRIPGIVGNEIDLDAAEPGHVDRVFHQTRSRLIAALRDFERMAMQVDRVIIAALVGHHEAIALAACVYAVPKAPPMTMPLAPAPIRSPRWSSHDRDRGASVAAIRHPFHNDPPRWN